MRKMQQKTYQDLLIAASASKSERSLDRLLQAERIARKTLTNRHDEELGKSLRNSVARLVRWLDEPFSTQLAEQLILEHVRATTPNLSGKRVRNRFDLTCPVCSNEFTPEDARQDRGVIRSSWKRDGNFVVRYRCGRCESFWEDTYRLKGKKAVGEPVQRVIQDGRF